MDKKIIFAGLLTISTVSHAADTNHLISIGTNGFGWSGASGILKWDEDKSGVKDSTATGGNLEFNYAYIFDGGFMLGLAASSETINTETKVSNGDKIKAESSTTSIALVLGYNFSSNLNESFWVKGYIGSSTDKSKTTDETDPANNSNENSTSSDLTFEVGKRFSLSSWGLSNVTYSPSIEYALLKYGGDDKDQGKESFASLRLNILKVDILF